MITGKILNIEPTQEGGYQSQNGYIHTFQMTIETPNGPMSGEIGSKTESYPVAVGNEITVNVTNDSQRGTKFKKINPQYETHQPQQGGQQARQATTAPKRDYDKENRGKCRLNLYCACIKAGCDPKTLNASRETLIAIEGLIEKSMNGIGNVGMLPPKNSPDDNSNPDYVGDNPPPPKDDSIPF